MTGYGVDFYPQFRRRLPPLPLALITALAMSPLPEEQPVHELAWPCPHAVPRPTVTARGKGFVGPAAEKRIDKLINGDQSALPVVHASPPPGIEMLTVMPCTSSSVIQASSLSSRACLCPMIEPEATANASALASTRLTRSASEMPRA